MTHGEMCKIVADAAKLQPNPGEWFKENIDHLSTEMQEGFGMVSILTLQGITCRHFLMGFLCALELQRRLEVETLEKLKDIQ